MEEQLYGVGLVRWIRETMAEMKTDQEQFADWKRAWFKTYKKLKGESGFSEATGTKQCPQHAAYGLWRLGRIRDSGLTLLCWTLEAVDSILGKNAAYAVLALDLREDGDNDAEVWRKVRERYERELGKKPARSQQGAVKVALGLLRAGQIVPLPTTGHGIRQEPLGEDKPNNV